MKIDIPTWDDPQDVQDLINDYNHKHNLNIKIVAFENRAGTYFATIESNKLTIKDAFYLGKNYGIMIERFREKGML